MEKEKKEVVLTKEEYEKLKLQAEQYRELLENTSNRILKQNIEAYKILGSENWGK